MFALTRRQFPWYNWYSHFQTVYFAFLAVPVFGVLMGTSWSCRLVKAQVGGTLTVWMIQKLTIFLFQKLHPFFLNRYNCTIMQNARNDPHYRPENRLKDTKMESCNLVHRISTMRRVLVFLEEWKAYQPVQYGMNGLFISKISSAERRLQSWIH